MAVNRYYRPSSPRYTSQFVEKQYPADLMLGAMQMKQQQLQKFAEETGKFQAEIVAMPNGNRTQRMAPKIREYYTNKILNFTNNYRDNYDSPQALSELTQMRMEFIKDPNLQLMKRDYEDTQIYNQIKLKAEAGDIDPNVHPQTGQYEQWEPGMGYTPYQPFIKSADWQERALQTYRLITPKTISGFSETAYVNDWDQPSLKKVQTDMEVRDPAMLKEATIIMAQSALNKETPEGIYLYEITKRQLGRTPTLEDMVQAYQPYENASALVKQQSRTSTEAVNLGDTTTKDAETFLGGDSTMMKGSATEGNAFSDIQKQEVKRQWRTKINNPNLKPEEDVELANIEAYLRKTSGWDNLSDREKRIKRNEFVETQSKASYNLNIDVITDPKVRGEVSKILSSLYNENGLLKESANAELISGARLFNYRSGEEITKDKDKRAVLSKGDQFEVLGRISGGPDGTRDLQQVPGLIAIASSQGTFLMQIPKLAEQDKAEWNLNSHKRKFVSGVGDTYIMYFNPNDPSNYEPQFMDLTDIPGDPREEVLVTTNENALYGKTIRDYNRNGDVFVKVFAKNPIVAEKEGQKVLDTNNKYLVKEYNVKNYGNDMISLYQQIQKDAEENLIKANNILNR